MRQPLKCSFTFFQVFRSIGYRSVAIDNDIPFGDKNGVVLCEFNDGHVADYQVYGQFSHSIVSIFFVFFKSIVFDRDAGKGGRRGGGARPSCPFSRGARGGGKSALL